MTEWMPTWTEELAGGSASGIGVALSWGVLASLLVLLAVVVFVWRTVRRRHFWCAEQKREVEVEFEEHGFPGAPYAVLVKRCSVFDPPGAITCGRRCRHGEFRRRWESALPIRMKAG